MIVLCIRRSIEYRTNHHRYGRADENPKALHRENSGDKRATRLLVGELRHDRRRQRIITANPDAEHEPEESQSPQHAVPSPADGEAASDGAQHHEHQWEPVYAPPPDLITEAAEDELTNHSPQQRQPYQEGDHKSWGFVLLLKVWLILVVDPSDQFHDGRNTEEVVGVGKETHAGDDDGLEVVILGFSSVKGRKDF